MANLSFKQGKWSSEMFGDNKRLGSSIKNFSEGTIYVVTDQKAIYLDTYNQKQNPTEADQQRIRLQGTVQYYESLEKWHAEVSPPYNGDVIYFIADENAFMRYDESQETGSKWVQLNTTAKTATELLGLIQGQREAIADLGEEVEAIKTAIGEAGTGDNILTRLTNAEQNITNINTKNDTQDGRLDKIEEVLGDIDNNPTGTTVLGRLSEIEDNFGSLSGTVQDHSDALEIIIGEDGQGGEIKSLKDRAQALEDAIGTEELADGSIKKNINDLKTAIGTEELTDGSIKQNINDLKNTVSGQGSSIQGLTDNFTALTETVSKKVDNDTFEKFKDEDFNSFVNNTTININAISGTLNTVAGKADENAGNISSLQGAVGGINETIEDHTTRIEALETGVEELEGRVNTIVNNHTPRIEALEKDANDLKGRVTEAEGNISSLQGALGDLSSDVKANSEQIKELNNAKDELKNNIDSHIKAANAMVYKDGVVSWSDLNNKAAENTDLSVGQTYIATANFGSQNAPSGYGQVYAGDILIATGTETDGKLTTEPNQENTVVWVHVSSGYVLEHMPQLAITENKITLTSLGGTSATTGDLGEFEIVSGSNNVTVSLTEAEGANSGKVTVGLVWDTF